MPKFIDMIINPSAKTYREALSELLRRAYFGDSASKQLLLRLSDLYVLASHQYEFIALYGEERFWGEVFEIIGSLPVHDRLVILAEAYRYDRTVHDELLDELVNFKKQLIREGAPLSLINAVNAILSELGKPDDVYRDIKHLKALYDSWKEMGEQFDESLVTISPRAKQAVTKTEVAKLLNFIVSQLRSGRRVVARDVRRFLGSDALAATLIRELKRRGFLIYDQKLRTYMPTDRGLEYIAASESVDDLYEKLKGGSP